VVTNQLSFGGFKFQDVPVSRTRVILWLLWMYFVEVPGLQLGCSVELFYTPGFICELRQARSSASGIGGGYLTPP
jgi:hypothetical protein